MAEPKSVRVPLPAVVLTAVVVLLLCGLTELGRQLIVLVVLAVAPGLAVTEMAGIADRSIRAVLVIPVSLAVDMLVAAIFIYVGVWSPILVLAVVATATVAGFAFADRSRVATGGLVLVGLLPTFVLLAGGP